MKRTSSGFTVAELLVAIIIIAILAALTIVTYSGLQQRARQSVIEDDLQHLNRSILAARINQGQTLAEITESDHTYIQCFAEPTGKDLSTLPKTDSCWVDYISALNKISAASGSSLKIIVDPWGRPYLIDENEGISPGQPCKQDRVALFTMPFVHSQFGSTDTIFIENSLSNC